MADRATNRLMPKCYGTLQKLAVNEMAPLSSPSMTLMNLTSSGTYPDEFTKIMPFGSGFAETLRGNSHVGRTENHLLTPNGSRTSLTIISETRIALRCLNTLVNGWIPPALGSLLGVILSSARAVRFK